MQYSSPRLLTQPFVAVFTITIALLALAASWQAADAATLQQLDPGTLLLMLGLAGGVVLAYHFPIHVEYRLKLELTSLPLYLMAVLLPLPIAILTAGAGILAAELMVRSQRGNLFSDIATQTGRLMLAVAAAGLVAGQLAAPGVPVLVMLISAAVALWLLEALTLPLVVTPVTHEPAWQVMRAHALEGSSTEIAQYITGIVGALAAYEEPLALLGLLMPAALAYRSFKSAREMQSGTRAMMENLADTVDLRDPYTGGHSRRVAELCAGIMPHLNLQGHDVELILAAARVHDIGKIGVPDYVLHKPGPLTPAERKIMESHSELGAQLLRRYSDFARGVAIVRHHHERWDGDGYPARLKATEIPFGARILAVADSFDAMTSDRPYRDGMAPQRAAEILLAGRGGQWDAEVVDAFLVSIAELLAPTPLAPESQLDPQSEPEPQPAGDPMLSPTPQPAG